MCHFFFSSRHGCQSYFPKLQGEFSRIRDIFARCAAGKTQDLLRIVAAADPNVQGFSKAHMPLGPDLVMVRGVGGEFYLSILSFVGGWYSWLLKGNQSWGPGTIFHMFPSFSTSMIVEGWSFLFPSQPCHTFPQKSHMLALSILDP